MFPIGIRGSNWRHWLPTLLCVVLCSTPVLGQVQPPDHKSEANRARFDELNPAARQAIERATRWLAREQLDSSGSWPSKPPRYKMSVSALAGLALLAHGDTPETGRYSKNVLALVKWILKAQDDCAVRQPNYKGLIFDRPTASSDDRAMHGHGFALLFLAECYGMTRDPALRRRMHKAIRAGALLTQKSMTHRGGWFYHPSARPGDQYQDEGSVTITQIQALRSAHDAGVEVDTSVILRAVRYIKESQDPKTGGVHYTYKTGKTSAALTAAGISVLHGSGEYFGPAIELGYDYLRLYLDPNRHEGFFYYTHLYGVQAMFQRGGPEWASYFPKIRSELLQRLGDRPCWEHRFGRTYATAISLLILQVPLRYLPIYQR